MEKYPLRQLAGGLPYCTYGSEGGTRHTYWVNGPYPTQRSVGTDQGSFWTAYGRESLVAARGGTLKEGMIRKARHVLGTILR